MSNEVDFLDRRILRVLYGDVRASYKSIGDRLGVSHNTVKARIDRMLEDEVFGFAIITRPDKVGMEATAYLTISAEPARHQEIARALAERREVSYLGFTIGDGDILALGHFASNQALFTFVNSFAGTLPGVQSVRIILMCETVKGFSAQHRSMIDEVSSLFNDEPVSLDEAPRTAWQQAMIAPRRPRRTAPNPTSPGGQT